MEENQKNEIYSQRVRAGKRTYFFDVRQTKSGDYYLTITESKKKFKEDGGANDNVFFEKHKIFLYKEDFEKFKKALDYTIQFIDTGEAPHIEETSEDTDLNWEV